MTSRKVIVVGAGRVGRRVVRDLPRAWEITVIDSAAGRLALVPDSRPGPDGVAVPVRTMVGDASRRLVLERAGLSSAVVLAVLTGDESVNREVARLARQDFGVEELVVKLHGERDIEKLGLLPEEVILTHTATAALATNRLAATETRAVALGMGQGELRQVTVLDGSPARGRQLMDLNPQRWLVAAVYRKGALIVPHGETVLESGDRVLLVGEPDVLDGVGEFIRGSRPVFPSQYGCMIGMLGDDTTREEAGWVHDHTCVQAVVSLDAAAVHPARRSREEISSHMAENNVGILVLDPKPVSLAARIGLTRSSRMELIHASQVPVLVARNSAPYARVLLAVGLEQHAESIASVAIDIARQSKAALTVLTVTAPALAEGEAEQAEQRELPAKISRLARMHGIEVERRLDQGNPIERIRHHAKDFDLLVIGASSDRRSTLLTPDISLYLLHDTPCSLLMVPWNPAHR